MNKKKYRRVVIENVYPEVDCGDSPIKRAVGEKVVVEADVFCDGRIDVGAELLYRKGDDGEWNKKRMSPVGNDRWEGWFTVKDLGKYFYKVRGWIDRFSTFQEDLKRKFEAGQDVKVDLLIGSKQIEKAAERASGKDSKRLGEVARELRKESEVSSAVSLVLSDEVESLMNAYPDKSSAVTYEKEHSVLVDRRKALFSSWYEMFPRSCVQRSKEHGTFKDCEKLLPKIAEMGFDFLYFPPIHPVGKTNRRGKNNSPEAGPEDPGSPWSIGSEEGGHKSVHPKLGTIEDFERLVKKAKKFGLEIALDLTFACSYDHPYLEEHPEWFKKRPNGSIQYAENPPKKYQDTVPFDFGTEDWRELWEELKSIVLFWAEKGVRTFRVDNPHTKPFEFWEWLIEKVRQEYPEIIFLSEAFTRPKVMYKLAKVGFNQSYTYFTWRNTKWELIDYLTELTREEVREYFRPNFWPNTPDILPEFLQYGGRSAFILRLVLAGTLSSNYGIYGPAFELCVSDAIPGDEEYMNSEKYEIKDWNWDKPGNIRNVVRRVNQIRRQNEALQTTWNLEFYETDNDQIISYGKSTEDLSNIILTVVNLDPHHQQSGWIRVPIGRFGIEPDEPYLVHDHLSDDKYIWHNEWNYVELDPEKMPAHIFELKKALRHEEDFDYFM